MPFWLVILSGYEGIFHYDFDLHFPNDTEPEKEKATHSSILAWRIPWTEKPGRLHTVHGVTNSLTQLSNSHTYWLIANLQCYVSSKCTAKWFIYILFQILFHHRLFQDIEYSSLGYTIGFCLPSLYIVACIPDSCLSLSPAPNLYYPFGNHKVVFCLWVYFCFVNKFTCIIF